METNIRYTFVLTKKISFKKLFVYCFDYLLNLIILIVKKLTLSYVLPEDLR